MTSSPIETKLAAARTKLILDKPFLGALVLRLPMEAAQGAWCETTATDARKFYYNPEYIGALNLAETQFVLAHEALHCALSHFSRRQHRICHRWDLACDFAINPLLLDDGLTPPPDSLLLDQFRGMTAEEIYPLLDEFEDKETLDHHAYDKDNQEKSGSGKTENDLSKEQEQEDGSSTGDSPQVEIDQSAGGNTPPPALGPDEQETLSIQWQQRMAGAAQQAMQAGKLGGTLARMIDHLLQPQLPWRMLLARHLSSNARDDYSYMRPSRREGAFILPSLRSQQIDLVVALDTSGSIAEEELSQFISEIDAIKGQLRARVTLVACDASLAEDGPWVFEPWEEFKLPRTFTGGGGTRFSPVFEWVEKQGLQPETLIYFTDAEGRFPETPPHYHVVWLVKGKCTVPWGERIQLN
ncbi:MAG: VWA-like domain-containing protein [Candidatus Sedimenticola sp. (ex Thyasira tokunagai)]